MCKAQALSQKGEGELAILSWHDRAGAIDRSYRSPPQRSGIVLNAVGSKERALRNRRALCLMISPLWELVLITTTLWLNVY